MIGKRCIVNCGRFKDAKGVIIQTGNNLTPSMFAYLVKIQNVKAIIFPADLKIID